MPLLAPTELAAYLREDASHPGLTAALEAAEAVVASYLGAPTLASRPITETRTIRRPKVILELLDGPLTGLTGVTVDGQPVDLSQVQTSYWAIAYPAGFGEGSTVTVSYTAGWTSTTLPGPVRQAVLLVAASIYARPDAGIARIGSVDGTTTLYRSDYVSPAVRTLLLAYRRPRV